MKWSISLNRLCGCRGSVVGRHWVELKWRPWLDTDQRSGGLPGAAWSCWPGVPRPVRGDGWLPGEGSRLTLGDPLTVRARLQGPSKPTPPPAEGVRLHEQWRPRWPPPPPCPLPDCCTLPPSPLTLCYCVCLRTSQLAGFRAL